MTDLHELRLRELLLAFVADHPGREGRISELFGARFPEEVTLLHAEVQERHLETIRGRLAAPSNGWAPSWLTSVLRLRARPLPLRRDRWQWAAAFVAASILLVLLVLNLPGVLNKNTIAEGPPNTTQPGPLTPNNVSPKGPSVTIERQPRPLRPLKDSVVRDKPAPRLLPKGGRKPDGLLATKVEVGSFVDVTGEPTFRLPGGAASKVLLNGPLYAGATVETGDMDKAEIEFSDGTTVSMDYNTGVRVLLPPEGALGAIRPEEIELSHGSVSVVVMHAVESSAFAVKTPVATATVLGTKFNLRLQPKRAKNPQLKAVLQVEEGRVAFSNGFGSVVAGASTESTATRSSAPSTPKRLATLKLWRPLGSRFTTSFGTSRLSTEGSTWMFVYPVGWTGVNVQNTPEGRVRVSAVHEESQSQLKVGDLVQELDGRAVTHADEVTRAFAKKREAPYALVIDRHGERIEITFKKKQRGFVGVNLSPDLEGPLYDATWQAISGQENRSLELLSTLSRERPNAATFNNLGVVHEMGDRMDLAIRNFKAAVALGPKAPLFRFNLAGALVKIGNFERAMEEFRAGLEIEPGYWALFAGEANALRLLDRNEELIALVEAKLPTFKQFAWYWIVRGEALHHAGRLDDAIAAFQQASKINPSNWDAYHKIALVHNDKRQFAESEAAYRRAIEINPYSTVSLGNLASLFGVLGRYAEAEEVARRVIAQNPHYAMGYDVLGDALLHFGRYAESEATYRKSIELDPGSATPHGNLANLLKKIDRRPEAEAEYRKAIELNPRSLEAHSNFGSLLRDTGRPVEAEEHFRKAIELDPFYPTGHYNLGVHLEGLGRIAEAEKEYRKTIEVDPQYTDAYVALGSLLKDKGQMKEAEGQYRKAIELDPAGTGVRSNLGNVLRETGRAVDAEKEFRKALEIDPRSARCLSDLGNVLADLGRVVEAETEYRKALAIDPRYALAHANLGVLLTRAGREQEAEAEFRMAIKLDPSYAQAYANLGVLLRRIGQVAEAETELRKAIVLNPKDPKFHYSLMLVLDAAGRPVEAEAEFRLAIKLDPRNVTYHKDLGSVLQNAGRQSDAEAMFRKALEIDPKYSPAYDSLGNLLASQGRLVEAEAAYRRAIELRATSPYYGTHNNLGLVLADQGRLSEAEAAFRQAIAIAPAEFMPYVSLGDFLEGQGRLEEADAVRAVGLNHAPTNARLLNSLAWSFAERGIKLDEARNFAQRAVKASPKDGAILDTLGWVHYKRGDYADAETQLLKAVDLYGKDPGVAEVWVHLGAVYEKMKAIEKAKDAYKKALSIQPANKEAAEALKRLGG